MVPLCRGTFPSAVRATSRRQTGHRPRCCRGRSVTVPPLFVAGLQPSRRAMTAIVLYRGQAIRSSAAQGHPSGAARTPDRRQIRMPVTASPLHTPVMVTSGEDLPVLTIDGANFSDFDGFAREFSTLLCHHAWHGNLDASTTFFEAGSGPPRADGY